MGGAAVAKPGVILAAFAPIETDDDAQTGELRAYFAAAWEACGRLGMDARIESLGVPSELQWPVAGSDYADIELIAARQRPAADGSAYQAIVFAVHDSIAFVAMLAPNRPEDRLSTWGTLCAEWAAAGPPAELPAACLGEARLLTALSALDAEQIPSLGAEVRASLPDGVLPAAPEAFFRSDEDLFTWEHGRAPQGSTLAVLASSAREEALDRWTWWDNRLGRRGLDGSLLHLLLHVFKLRRERRAFDGRAAHLREVERDSDAALAELMEVLGDAGADIRERSTTHDLLRFQNALAREQVRSGGLLFQMSKLRELRQTVTAAGFNIGVLTPPPHEGSPAVLFAQDVLLAERLPQQIDLDLSYAEAVRERTQEVYGITSLRLQEGLDHRAREQARLSLFQTSLLGALLAAVGAITAFDAHIKLATRERGPLIAVVAGSVLALPNLIVNWSERYRALEYVLTAVYGAAWGWLITRIAERGRPLQVIGSVIGAIVLPLLAQALQKYVAGRRGATK